LRAWTWLTKKQTTNLGQVGVGISIAALTAFATLLLKLLGPTSRVSGYFLVITAGVFLLVGSLVTWQIANLSMDKVELELELAKQQLATLEPDREALRRLLTYFNHAHGLVEQILQGELSFPDLHGQTARRSLYAMTAEFLHAGTDRQVAVSVWVEPPVGRVTGAIQRLPEQISDRLDHRSFQIVGSRNHDDDDLEAFAVHVEPSWLKYNYRQEIDGKRRQAYSAGDFDLSGLRGPDLAAFKKQGYKSVCAASFCRSGGVGYFVVLSKEPQTFTQVEEQYLLWIGRVLELDEVIRTGKSVTVQ
jgi:hypothetical protein